MSKVGDPRYLLDTNVISEATRPIPNARVAAWLADADEDQVFLSVVTLAEIQRGIAKLAAGKKRRRLEAWLIDDLIPRFDGRLLPIDPAVAVLWGDVVARCERAGRPIDALDALIAATAERHGLTLVTRNGGDFAGVGLTVVNPWQEDVKP